MGPGLEETRVLLTLQLPRGGGASLCFRHLGEGSELKMLTH